MRNELKELFRQLNAIQLKDRHYLLIMLILFIIMSKISPLP